MKKFVSLILMLSIIFTAGINVFSAELLCADQLYTEEIVSIENEFLEYDIKVTTTVTERNYYYANSDGKAIPQSDDEYKYKSREITKCFYGNSGEMIAMGAATVSFRYNEVCGEAKCLGAKSEVIYLGDVYKLNVFARITNITTDAGALCANFNLSSYGHNYYDCQLTVFCNSLGEISYG